MMETKKRVAAGAKSERPYKGIRMRKWGKWVAEIREPNKRSRIWLGSYSTPVAAARAYDTAVFYLRGPSARLNFPEFVAGEAQSAGGLNDLSAASIRQKATEVGARVDAMETAMHHHHHIHGRPPSDYGRFNSSSNNNNNNNNTPTEACGFEEKPDLNKLPDPENSEDEGGWWRD